MTPEVLTAMINAVKQATQGHYQLQQAQLMSGIDPSQLAQQQQDINSMRQGMPQGMPQGTPPMQWPPQRQRVRPPMQWPPILGPGPMGGGQMTPMGSPDMMRQIMSSLGSQRFGQAPYRVGSVGGRGRTNPMRGLI